MDEQNSIDIWSDDLLGRRSEAIFIEEFIVNRIYERGEENKSKSYVLNLDGSWGQGKSFFLERFDKQLKQNNHLSVYVNAWKDDHADDPMISVMAAVDEALKSHLAKQPILAKAWETTKRKGMLIAIAAMRSGGKKLASKFLDEGIEGISEAISDNQSLSNVSKGVNKDVIAKKAEAAVEKFIDMRADKAMKKFQDTKITIETFRSSLSSFIKQFSDKSDFSIPLFILIDELDRCRPTYAISTLERIKHFFDVDGVAFVIATDSSQLKHSIKAVYGQEFDSNRYLLRFFDRTYKFQKPTHGNFIEYLFASKPMDPDKFFTYFVSTQEMFLKMTSGGKLNLSLRDISQCYDYLRTISTTWKSKSPINTMYMIQIIIYYQQGLEMFYNQALNMIMTTELKDHFGHAGVLVRRRGEDPYGRSIGHPDITYGDVLEKIYSLSRYNLVEVLKTRQSTAWEEEVSEYFIKEFSLIHGNTVKNNTDAPKSIISSYYNYVESAGRLEAAPEI